MGRYDTLKELVERAYVAADEYVADLRQSEGPAYFFGDEARKDLRSALCNLIAAAKNEETDIGAKS